jgi:hypothetical protein
MPKGDKGDFQPLTDEEVMQPPSADLAKALVQ